MRTIMAPVGLGLIFLSSPAPAQSWLAAARQCGEELAASFQQTHGYPCVSCFAGWPAIARCTVGTIEPGISKGELDACIGRVNDEDWRLPQAHDRVADVVACAMRR
jgi:hypothetical protein